MHQNACPWAFCEDSAPFESREGLKEIREALGERREAEGSLCSEHALADVWDIAVTGSANLRRRQGFD